jgi:nitroreductase
MLACRARGLGTAWTTLHLQYETEIAALLGLPDDVRQGVLIPTA